MNSNLQNTLFFLLTLQSTSGLITVTNKLTKQVAFKISNHEFVPFNSEPVKPKTFIILADPPDGCSRVKPPPNLSRIYERRDDDMDKIEEPNWVLFVPESTGCGVEEKILTAQRFNYSGIIIQKGGYFETDLPTELRGQPDRGYHINVSFVSEADGNVLIQSYVFPKKKLIYTVEMVENESWAEFAHSFASSCFETLIGSEMIQLVVRGRSDFLEWIISSPHKLMKWAYTTKKFFKMLKSFGNFMLSASLLFLPVLFLYCYQYIETRRNTQWTGYVPPRSDQTYGSSGRGSNDEDSDNERGNKNKPDMYRCLQLLELKKGATEDEIKKSYHRLARLYHSDKTGGQDEEVRKRKEDKFKEINNAKTILLEALQKNNGI